MKVKYCKPQIVGNDSIMNEWSCVPGMGATDCNRGTHYTACNRGGWG